MKGRPRKIKDCTIVSVHVAQKDWDQIKDLATAESIHTGMVISGQELIRHAIKFTYGDNERLRECFRRSRAAARYI